jgi:hypothetical protein
MDVEPFDRKGRQFGRPSYNMLGGRVIVRIMSKSWIEQGFGRDRQRDLS